MRKKLYIAYGSNLNVAQMAYRCPDAEIIGRGTLPNYRLVFQGNPIGAHANVIPEEGQEVPIGIWEINATDEKSLDIYEGVKGGYYTKETIEIDIRGKKRKALIYIMTPHGFGIPSESYLGTIATGYRDFNLNIDALDDAVQHAIDHTKWKYA